MSATTLNATTVAGSTTEVQFNDAGALGGDAGLTYDKTTDALTAGSLVVTNGQVAFPVAQNASTDVNTLDDYEEGSWTPVIGGSGGTSGQTYSTQIGRYIKVGKQVTVWGACVLTVKGTITTNVQVQGLPFTSDAGTGLFAIGSVRWTSLGVAYSDIVLVLGASLAAADLQGTTAATGTNANALTTADLTNSSEFAFTLTYRAVA